MVVLLAGSAISICPVASVWAVPRPAVLVLWLLLGVVGAIAAGHVAQWLRRAISSSASRPEVEQYHFAFCPTHWTPVQTYLAAKRPRDRQVMLPSHGTSALH